MSKKIMILNGSPRNNGNTAMLCEAFEKGATSKGNEVTRFNLSKMKIQHCTGCLQGGKDPESPCVLKDDMELIYPVYEKADIVVFATPVHYGAFSSQLKTAFDRLFAVAESNPSLANPVKECGLIMSALFNTPESWKVPLDYYNALTDFLQWKRLGTVLAGGVIEPGAVQGTQVMEEAFRFGASL